MNILSKVKEFLAKLIPQNHLKKVIFTVESVNTDRLLACHNSLGWYLEKLSNEGQVPVNIIHISTIGQTEKEIMVYFDERGCNVDEVKKFLQDIGVVVKIK